MEKSLKKTTDWTTEKVRGRVKKKERKNTSNDAQISQFDEFTVFYIHSSL